MGEFAKIAFGLNENVFWLEMEIDGNPSSESTRVDYSNETCRKYLFYWVLHKLKPLFFRMPFKKLDLSGNSIEIDRIITNTNNALITYKQLKDIAEGNRKILFLNVDDAPLYKSLFNELREETADHHVYLNMSSGFNGEALDWGQPSLPITLQSLIDLIVNTRIKKIISINNYMLDWFVNRDYVYLPCLLKHLGVEYSAIDHDGYDANFIGYMTKAAYHCSSFERFSLASFLQEYWDKAFGLKRICYIAPPCCSTSGADISIPELKPDYGIIVMSNSRINYVKSLIRQIAFLLDHLRGESVFLEVQLWYMASRRMILRNQEFCEYERMLYTGLVYRLFYGIVQFLKFEIIESLETQRGIEIYGDSGWGVVFSKYFKNKYLDSREVEELLQENRYLHLILNPAITYLDASIAIYEATKRGTPFINYPALVKTPELQGLRHIEYRNARELNWLVENIRDLVSNHELKESVQTYRNALDENTTEILRRLKGESRHDENLFEKLRRDHNAVLDRMVEEYSVVHEEFIQTAFQALCLGRPVQYDFSKSEYYNRRYVQEILKVG